MKNKSKILTRVETESAYDNFIELMDSKDLVSLKRLDPQGEDTANYFIYNFGDKRLYFNKINKITGIDDLGSENPDLDYDPTFRALIASSNSINHIYDSIEPLKDQLSLDAFSFDFTDQLTRNDFKKAMTHSINNLIIIASPNKGKTSKTIEYLISRKQKFIFLVPLRFQVEQNKNENVGTLLGGDKKNIPQLLNNYSYIMTTYDSFLRLDHYIKNKWDYYLVIDEFHKLVTDSDYRSTSMLYIDSIKFQYRRFIGLTGTPYGCINKNFDTNNIELIRFKSNDDSPNILKNYNIIQYKGKTKESGLDSLLSHIKNNIKEGITVVFVNDKKLLRSINDYLITENVFPEPEIMISDSDNKNDPEVVEMILTSKVSSTKKIILTTSVMSTGINLNNENFNSFYVLCESNLVEIIQFINRFRDGIDNIYDFIPNNNSVLQKFDFESLINSLNSYYQEIADNMTSIYRNNANMMTIFKEQDKNKTTEYIYMTDYGYALNKNLIRWEVLKILHNNALSNIELRVEYLKLYEINNVLIEIDKENYSLDFSKSKEFRKKLNQSNLETCILYLSKNISEFVTVMGKNNLIDRALIAQEPARRLIKDLTPEELSTFQSMFNGIIRNREIKDFVNKFLFFYNIGIPTNVCIDMVKNDKFNKLYIAIKYLRLLKLINVPKSALSSKVTDVSFIESVDKYIRYNKDNLLFQALSEYISNEKSSSEFKEHLKSSSYERLKYIYRLGKKSRKTGSGKNRKSVGTIYFYSGVNNAQDLFKLLKIKADNESIKNLDNYIS